MTAFSLSGVTARYASDMGTGAPPPLREASLAVPEGAVVALLGPNGAGKSTLLRVLAGTLAPESGEVLVQGVRPSSIEPTERARRIAFVSHRSSVEFGFTVREVVAMGRAPHQGAWLHPAPEDERVVREALECFDLTALAGRSADQLSAGELQRVSLARGLAQAPRLLLLDEPTTALDVRHQIGLFEQLVALSGTCTVVLATHDLHLAAAYATHAVLLQRGNVLFSGRSEDALTTERLSTLFDWPIVQGRVDGTLLFFPRTRRAEGRD